MKSLYILLTNFFMLFFVSNINAQLENEMVCGHTGEETTILMKKSFQNGLLSIDPTPTGKNFKVSVLYFKADNDDFDASDTTYSTELRCRVGEWPPDSSKPNWEGELLINTAFNSQTVDTDTAAKPNSITTYFYKMSDGNLWIYGDEVVYEGPPIDLAQNEPDWEDINKDVHQWYIDNYDLSSLDNDNDGEVDMIIFVNRARYDMGYMGVAVGYLPDGLITDSSDPNEPDIEGSSYISTNSGVYQKDVYDLSHRYIIFHEMGHHLRGLGHINGLHRWNLMSGGEDDPPTGSGLVQSAWEKEELGWLTIPVLSHDTTGYELQDITSSHKAVKIPVNSNDYFLLENRVNNTHFEITPNQGCGASEGLGEGLLVSYSRNNQPPDIRAADDDVENLGTPDDPRLDGDSTDLFPNGGVTSITPYTTPHTNDHNDNNTHIAITDIQYNGENIVFNVYQNYWSDTLATNTTWSSDDTVTVGGDITIPSGVTLLIQSGARVEFLDSDDQSGGNSSAKPEIIVNGTLQADDVTFTADTKGDWYGIVFNSTATSSSYLDSCTVENAYDAVYIDGSCPAITDCEIKDADHKGIVIINSGAAPTVQECYIHSCDSYPVYLCNTSGSEAKILNNKIYGGSTSAVYMSYSDGDFAENEFKTSSGSTSFGVYVFGSSSNPDFDAKEGDTGNLFDLSNIASHGAYVAGGSPEFGDSGPHDGDNDFINRGSDKFIYNNTGSTVNAESNYWDGTPDTSLFYGDIDDSPHDDDSNSAGPSWKRTLSPYWAGNQMYEEGQYQEALTELLSALQQEPESEKASIAVFKMAKSALKLGQLADQEAFLLNMTKGTHPEVQHMARVWLAYLYATQKKMSKAEEIAFKAPTGTRAERTELLSLVSYYASQGDQPSADRIAGVLRSSHKDEYLEFDLNAALEAPLELSEPLASTKDKTESVALTNYPNPFNPTTTIRFALPDKKFVRLRVFDVLGRQVRTLANRKMSAGIHQIIWDGRNSAGAGVAAGIYFASLKTGNEIKTIKLLLVR